MVTRCKKCNTKVIERPLWKGQEFDEPFAWNKLIWKNALWPGWYSIIFFVTIMVLAWSMAQTLEVYYDFLENPCDFVERNQQACEEMKAFESGVWIVPEGHNLSIPIIDYNG